MPTVLRIGSYRFFFYSYDLGERVHIHVIRERNEAKFWLDPISLADNQGLAAHEIKTVIKLIAEHKKEIEDAWNKHKKRR